MILKRPAHHFLHRPAMATPLKFKQIRRISASHPASLAALIPLKPGQTANLDRTGRPKGSKNKGSIVNFLRERLSDVGSDPLKYQSLADELSAMLLNMAKKRNVRALMMILERTETKQITEADLHNEIERVFNIVCRYISDREILGRIAKDLKLDGANDVEPDDE